MATDDVELNGPSHFPPERSVLDLPVYMDNHATTRPDPRVIAAMMPYFTSLYGNAASVHRFGRDAAEAVDQARDLIARLIGAESREIVFTSGATEANNLALKGAVENLKTRGDHIVSAVSEHKAVLDPLRRLSREGWKVTFVPCDETGMVTLDAVATAVTD